VERALQRVTVAPSTPMLRMRETAGARRPSGICPVCAKWNSVQSCSIESGEESSRKRAVREIYEEEDTCMCHMW
jgi:hypothetical protein